MFTTFKIYNQEEENRRVEELMSYDVFNPLPEEELDELTKLVSIIYEAPISVIALVDRYRVLLKSNMGIEGCEIIKEIAFCNYTIKQDDVFIIEDATKDYRFRDNPFVLDFPWVRSYCGVPLVTPSGYNIGTLCFSYKKPRSVTENEK